MLKFGCPGHDIVPCIKESGFDTSSLGCNLLCNGYSLECHKKDNNGVCSARDSLVARLENKNDSSIVVGEWSLAQLQLKFERYNQSETTVHIDMFELIDSKRNNSNVSNNNNNNSECCQRSVFSLVLHLLRCGDATFPKRFRPGVYKYNGKGSDDSRDKENKLGTWVRFISFFVSFFLFVCYVCIRLCWVVSFRLFCFLLLLSLLFVFDNEQCSLMHL